MTTPSDGGVALPAEDPEKYSQESGAGALEAKAPRSFVTYALIGINVAVFLAMVTSGVDSVRPNGWDIVKWGGNYMPLTRNGQWWRLITSMFVHFGIIHLSLNMYALLQVGRYLEPLGRWRLSLAYFGTGIAGSLASLWFHTDNSVSAGASGAIFGLFGVVLALVMSDLFPKEYAKKMRSSVLTLLGINLFFGWQIGLDNAAHIGGLAAGLLFGYMYSRALRPQRPAPPNDSVGIDTSQYRVRF